ncbi:MAG: hypothetical protein ACFCVK_00125 [Acidimicrobiales bacterium]
MPPPDGFAWMQRKNGDVVITHHGKHAATPRGERARRFIDDVGETSGQELMARLTGNYKRGNERRGRDHQRNADRR